MESSQIELIIKQGTQEHKVALSGAATVVQLKQQLEAPTSLLPRQQKLIYKGKVLDDHQTLTSYKPTSGCKMMLMAAQASRISRQGRHVMPAWRAQHNTGATS